MDTRRTGSGWPGPPWRCSSTAQVRPRHDRSARPWYDLPHAPPCWAGSPARSRRPLATKEAATLTHLGDTISLPATIRPFHAAWNQGLHHLRRPPSPRCRTTPVTGC